MLQTIDGAMPTSMESEAEEPSRSVMVRVIVCHPAVRLWLWKDSRLSIIPSRFDHQRYWKGPFPQAWAQKRTASPRGKVRTSSGERIFALRMPSRQLRLSGVEIELARDTFSQPQLFRPADSSVPFGFRESTKPSVRPDPGSVAISLPPGPGVAGT